MPFPKIVAGYVPVFLVLLLKEMLNAMIIRYFVYNFDNN